MVCYKMQTGLGPGLVIKRRPGLIIKRGPVFRNHLPKSHEILMFFCLQKDAKQCCDVTKDGLYLLFWPNTCLASLETNISSRPEQ